MNTNIHSTVIIDPAVTVGSGVTIGPYSVIESDVQIGDNCVIGPHVIIGEGTRLGKNCKIFKGASVGLAPQDKKYAGEKTYLIIGDNTVLREFTTINRGTAARGETRIGSNCWIMAYCHVAHDCIVGNDVTMSNSVALAGHVEIGNHVTIGGLVGVHQFTRIGDFSIIAAMARPFMDVVPYAMCGGEGETRIIGINKVGLERQGFSPERRQNIKRAYRTLFREDSNLQDALSKLNETFGEDSDIQNLINFVKGGTRGIMRMKAEID